MKTRAFGERAGTPMPECGQCGRKLPMTSEHSRSKICRSSWIYLPKPLFRRHSVVAITNLISGAISAESGLGGRSAWIKVA